MKCKRCGTPVVQVVHYPLIVDIITTDDELECELWYCPTCETYTEVQIEIAEKMFEEAIEDEED